LDLDLYYYYREKNQEKERIPTRDSSVKHYNCGYYLSDQTNDQPTDSVDETRQILVLHAYNLVMRCLLALPALIAVAIAQSQKSSLATATKNPATSIENVEPTATETISGPIQTGRACAEVSRLIQQSRLVTPSVEAEAVYACLKSVPIDTDTATELIASLKQLVEYQSTLAYIKNPPEGYANEGVDIVSGLDDIGSKIASGTYNNQFDLETDIASLLASAHDGHFNFEGMAFRGTFQWRRARQIGLISAQSGTDSVPKIWSLQDYNKTDSSFKPSAVTKIDGKDVVQFLQDEAENNSYHDPDTRWNSMFYMQAAANLGSFVNPRLYPGPNTTLTFENGTERSYGNAAITQYAEAFQDIQTGQDFYDVFVKLQSSSKKFKKRETPHRIPQQLYHPRDILRGSTPLLYPEPIISHSAESVDLAGYFINTTTGTIGVLMSQTFSTDTNEESREYQSVIENYISEAKSRNITKHVIDVRGNGGGRVFLGYEMYLQFFPSQEPQLLSRIRASEGNKILGEHVSEYKQTQADMRLYLDPHNYNMWLDADMKPFDNWSDMLGDNTFNNDSFTSLLKYNLSDPLLTSSDEFGIGLTLTSHGDNKTKSTTPQDPFTNTDIVILTDGICASTCTLFTELMVQQSGVRTLALGGRPLPGPMQTVGGTKGSLVLQGEYLRQLGNAVVQDYASSTSEAAAWRKVLPMQIPITYSEANVNFQDNIRKGKEEGGVPTQFLNDTAGCRMWYEAEDYLDVSRLWGRVAGVAFGKEGGLDEGGCVQGSVMKEEQSPGNGNGNGNGNGKASPTPTVSAGPAKPSASQGAAVEVRRLGWGVWLGVWVGVWVVIGVVVW
jgi:hypothetical protein